MDAWYLKYRSQNVSELDLVAVRVALEKVLASGKVPQALLFTGPRGTGKTSAARILAKVLNCDKNSGKDKLSEPCNKCSQCLSTTNGSNIDVLEIDAASNRGIDDVRELRERVKLAPSGGRYRVYIIDEVHMLTNEAFNALLKTLEEPPAHAVFILCTTDAQKVPETILSRCTRIIFKQATEDEVVGKLEKVAGGEKLKVEMEALKLIARGAKGSFRDAIKLLEQVAGGESGKKISLAEVQDLLGQAKGVEPEALLTCLVKRDVDGALGEVDKAVSAGVNIKNYIERLVEVLRVELLAEVGASGVEREGPVLGLSIEETDLLIRIFSRAYAELRDAVLPQLPLELAVVEWCRKDVGNQKESKVGEVQDQKEEEVIVSKVKEAAKPTTVEETVVAVTIEPVVATAKAVEKPDGVVKDRDVLVDISLERVSEHWAEIMQKVKPKNHSVEALLRACRPLSISGGFLNMEVYYKFHKDRLETEKCRSIVEETVAEVMGISLKLKYQLGERAARADGVVPDSAVVQKDDVSGKEVEEEIVKAAAEIFKGTVVE